GPLAHAEMPKAGFKDAKLLKEMSAIAAETLSPDQILVGVITDKGWNVEQNGLGIPTRRTIHASFAVKQSKGCRVFDLLFEQLAAGANKFNALSSPAGVGDSSEIACEKAK